MSADLKYPSTNVAVDLAFTDGTYLSRLGAVDQYGFGLSPQGQGASKVLYTNQWNLVRSQFGAVAKGKTIDRILVGYDNASGPGSLQGWLDDIKVSATPTPPASLRPSDNVLTTRGTLSNGSFSRGNNMPATAVPHGFNFWIPVTDAGTLSWMYSYHSRNNEQNLPALQAFSASHAPSPWMADRQTFQFLPSTAAGVPNPDREARKLPFKHSNETARAHYYGVDFENGIKAEVAPADHAALYRFKFPGADSNLIFDNVNNNGGLTLDQAAGTVIGYSDVRSGLSAGAAEHGVSLEIGEVNGGPAVVATSGGTLMGVLGVELVDGRIAGLRTPRGHEPGQARVPFAAALALRRRSAVVAHARTATCRQVVTFRMAAFLQARERLL
jgi:hypothetical protein